MVRDQVGQVDRIQNMGWEGQSCGSWYIFFHFDPSTNLLSSSGFSSNETE